MKSAGEFRHFTQRNTLSNTEAATAKAIEPTAQLPEQGRQATCLMSSSSYPKNVKCLGAFAASWNPVEALFFFLSFLVFILFQEGPSQLASGIWWGVCVKWADPEVSFKGMFNFHYLFPKSNFLQRQGE